jgi:hypothetical protein
MDLAAPRGEQGDPNPAAPVGRGQDHGPVIARTALQVDHVAGPEQGQGTPDLVARWGGGAGARPLAPVLLDVAVGAHRLGAQLGQLALAALRPGLEVHQLAVRLELGEREVSRWWASSEL